MVLINFMCLHDVLCDSLGVIQFDIYLVVSYFLKKKFTSPDFEMYYALVGVFTDCHSYLWYAMTTGDLISRALEGKPSVEVEKRVKEVQELHDKVREKIEKSNARY